MNPSESTKKNPSGHAAKKLIANMEQITWERTGPMSLENARRNVKFLDRGQSLAALREVPVGEGDHAIIVASGPSIKFISVWDLDPVVYAIKLHSFAQLTGKVLHGTHGNTINGHTVVAETR